MSLTNEMSPADIAAVSGGYGNNNGWGGDGAWWLLVLILAMNGGWGNGFGGNGGANIPLMMNTDTDVERGFDHMATMNGISALQSTVSTGFANTATQLCNGFAGVNQGVANGFAQAEIADNARQIANMNQAFAGQTAMMQGFNQIGSQFADCCCDNKLATADLKYTIATENCADRAAVNDGVRDIIANQTAGIQSILDKLCQQEIEAKNDTIAQLRSELMYARGQASQDVQTSAIQAGQRNLANEIEQYVNPTPRPAYVVQNPNCCAANTGCGCGF